MHDRSRNLLQVPVQDLDMSSGTRIYDRPWEGCHESRRCSRDTYPESYNTKYTIIRRKAFKVYRPARERSRSTRGFPPSQTSRVERLNAKVEPLLT